ncbi:hypothetical protein G6016_15200 [Dietzia aerolata]|uniref:SseB protein N-terminal domain-containing protein n=1 Tax=Dietzia aerolata TaxID=595984 RepID=A0ABV5JNC6_9ACTN|nr:hypothetical protein [Dietzia aerolata]MBB0970279.1 hypothetical protein [Dietzia aerolata]
MPERHWQIFAALSTTTDAPHEQVLGTVPGSALIQFADGTSEAAMLIDAATQDEAVLFVRLAMLELTVGLTSVTVSEVLPDPDAPFTPMVFDDPRLMRARSWARTLSQPIPTTTEPTDDGGL